MNERFIVSGNDGNVRIKLIGAFKTSDAEKFGELLMEQVKLNTKVILDMAETEFICSGVLREMLACQSVVDESDEKEMIINSVNEEIMEVFEMTGFINILTVE